MRMIHKAKQCCNVSIEQLLSETHANFVMIQLMKEMSGGAGTKDNQKTYVRNSLAATLLEQGFPFNWVSEATEKLVALVGLKQITQVSNLPPGKQRLDSILQLCEQCELSPPLAVSKSAQKVAQVGMNKARKRVAVNVNPADYRIEPSFSSLQRMMKSFRNSMKSDTRAAGSCSWALIKPSHGFESSRLFLLMSLPW